MNARVPCARVVSFYDDGKPLGRCNKDAGHQPPCAGTKAAIVMSMLQRIVSATIPPNNEAAYNAFQNANTALTAFVTHLQEVEGRALVDQNALWLKNERIAELTRELDAWVNAARAILNTSVPAALEAEVNAYNTESENIRATLTVSVRKLYEAYCGRVSAQAIAEVKAANPDPVTAQLRALRERLTAIEQDVAKLKRMHGSAP